MLRDSRWPLSPTKRVADHGPAPLPVFLTPLCWAENYLDRSVEVDTGFLKAPLASRERGREGGKGGRAVANGLVYKAVTGCAAAPWRPRRS